MLRAPGGWRQLEQREAFLLAFFAVFVVLTRAALRWKLHLTGHSMLPAVMLLLLARVCVRRPAAATAVGLLAGSACALLGMGQGGPLVVLRLLLPGVVVDLGAALGEERLFEAWTAALLGAVAGAADFLPMLLVEGLAGVDPGVVLAHAAFGAAAKAGFGAVGGVAGAALARRLRHHGLLPGAGVGAQAQGPA